jgi:hypothetical protein
VADGGGSWGKSLPDTVRLSITNCVIGSGINATSVTPKKLNVTKVGADSLKA